MEIGSAFFFIEAIIWAMYSAFCMYKSSQEDITPAAAIIWAVYFAMGIICVTVAMSFAFYFALSR